MYESSQLIDAGEDEEEQARSIEIGEDREESTSGNKRFKKYHWLNQHFIIKREGVECKYCSKMFKNRHSTRLNEHLKRSHPDKIEEGVDVIFDTTVNQDINILWAKTMIENNFPLRSVESDSFKLWASKLNWIPPSRRDLSSLYIPKLSRKLHHEFQVAASNLNAPVLSIEFDHWQDANGRSMLGVIATDPKGERHLLDLRDVSAKGHHAHIIVEDLADILKEVPKQAINSIVSDSAASCKKARIDLLKLQNYKHLIQHRCMAHLMNRLGQRITSKNSTMAEVITVATKINSFISSSAYWQASLQRLNHKKTSPACPTRWYSTVNMIENLLDLKPVILEEILPNIADDKARIILGLDWSKLREVLEVLRPINKCISYVEGKRASLGEAFGFLLNYTKELFASNEPCSEFNGAARASLLWFFGPKRMEENELGLYLATYVLDRRHKMQYVTEAGLTLALETIALIVKSSAPLHRIKSGLIDEFEDYCNFRGDYALDDTDDDAIKWWSSKHTSILMQAAVRLGHLKASSANIERTFSTLKHIQGGSRVNLAISSLVDICRMKISRGVILEDEEVDCTIPDVGEQETTEGSASSILEQSTVSVASDQSDSSEITYSQELFEWLETQDQEVNASYKRFFKYINFSILVEDITANQSESEEVSDEQIRELVRTSRDSQTYGVSYDSASQAARYDEAFARSNLED